MKNNNKIYIILSTFGILSLFLILFLVWPLLQEIENNSQDLISAKKDIIAFNAQIGETENFKKNYDTYKPNLEKMDQLFIDPNNPVDFIKFLENTASSSKVTSKISLPTYSKQVSQNFIIYQISSQGEFLGMSDFLRKIETGPYLIEIENLNIQNSEEKSIVKDYSSRKVNTTFTIKVFIQQ